MTAENLAVYAGVLLSLLFSYVPGLKAKYDALSSDAKRLVMLGALLVIAIGVYTLACAGYYPDISCDQPGLVELVKIFVAALIANQAAFLISPGKS